MFINPGALSTVQGRSVAVGFLKHLLDVNAGYATYVQQVENIGWIGAGVVYMNYGTQDRTDKAGNVNGTFGASDLAINVSYGDHYENLHYGGSVKYIHSQLAEFTASGIAIDVGASYSIPEQEIVIGLSVLNLGTQLSTFGKDKESLPLDIKLGVGKKLEHLPLNIMLNFHKLNEDRDSFFERFKAFSIGGEFTLSEVLKARFGYFNEMRSELKIGTKAGLAGFSGGIGLNIASYQFDYAFSSFGEIGSLHRVGISTTF